MSCPSSGSSGSPDGAVSGEDEGPPAGGISIDREGRWRHEGVVITHPGTVALFFRSLEADPSGGCLLRVGGETAPVEVEDAPFVVRSAEISPDAVALLLSDGSRESLDPATLTWAEDHVPYCRVKGGRFSARFSRPAYYLLAEAIEQDEGGAYLLRQGGRTHRLQISEPARKNGSAEKNSR